MFEEDSDSDESSSRVKLQRNRSRSPNNSQRQDKVKKRRLSRGRRSTISVIVHEGDDENYEEVIVPLEDDSDEPSQDGALAMKLVGLKAEIAELKAYERKLQLEQRQWKELFDEKQRQAVIAERDCGPKQISQSRFEKVCATYLSDMGPLYVFDSNVASFNRKMEEKLASNAYGDALREEVKQFESELRELEATGDAYVEHIREVEEMIRKQLQEYNEEIELLHN
ncbi:unnamed protein product [Toxocara canis]|nr:unnamed protein product [Toxocara canis]